MSVGRTSAVKLQVKRDWSRSTYSTWPSRRNGWLRFGRKARHFSELFETLDLSALLEIGCGRGRHAAHVMAHYPVGRMALVDNNESISEPARSGSLATRALRPFSIPAATCRVSQTALTRPLFHTMRWCISRMTTLPPTWRRPGALSYRAGMPFFTTNNDKRRGLVYSENKHWRNFMSAPLFSHMAQRAGLRVVRQRTIDWGEKDLDCSPREAGRLRPTRAPLPIR